MTNQRLRGAMMNAEVTPGRLATLVEVDIKTVQRWLTEGRIPYPTTRHKVARILDQQDTFLWPELLLDASGDAFDGFGGAGWPTRTAISSDHWHQLFASVTSRLDILVYAGSFLTDALDLGDVLRAKASSGTSVRVLVGDPSSAAVRARAAELGSSWLPERCRTTATSLLRRAGPAICVRPHGTTLYASHFRFDDVMLINLHAHGCWAAESPVLRLDDPHGDLFGFHEAAFDRVWASSAPRPSAPMA